MWHVVCLHVSRVADTRREIESYFELADAGVELIEEGLAEVTFGEFLVERAGVSRAQLLDAMMEQDRNPDIPIGEVIAFLGYLTYPEVDRWLTEWSSIPVVEVA
jgi:hypothetical protein